MVAQGTVCLLQIPSSSTNILKAGNEVIMEYLPHSVNREMRIYCVWSIPKRSPIGVKESSV